MLRFRFLAAVCAVCASFLMFAYSIVREEAWSVFWWATALMYSISVALLTVNNWLNWRGVRKRIRSGDGNLLPMEYLEMRFMPPSEFSALDREALEQIPGWAVRSDSKVK